MTTIFYVGDSAGTNNRGDTPLSLWRRVGSAPAVELIQGVEDLDVLYGIDNNTADDVTEVNQYVTSSLHAFRGMARLCGATRRQRGVLNPLFPFLERHRPEVSHCRVVRLSIAGCWSASVPTCITPINDPTVL